MGRQGETVEESKDAGLVETSEEEIERTMLFWFDLISKHAKNNEAEEE